PTAKRRRRPRRPPRPPRPRKRKPRRVKPRAATAPSSPPTPTSATSTTRAHAHWPKNKKAVRDVEGRIDALKKRRAGYDKELEFYQDKKGGATPPAKLAEDIQNT